MIITIPSKGTYEIRPVEATSSKYGSHSEVLDTSFVDKIPADKGWWYRLPSMSILSQEQEEVVSDHILPHMGTVFGLTEAVMLIILFQMECVKKKGDSYIIRHVKVLKI